VTAWPRRVLFVCLGNACRSQMAEAFARAYGSDVILPASAGLRPAVRVAPDTVRAMAEKSLDLNGQFPKSVRQLGRSGFDLGINMSDFALLDHFEFPIREWRVPDPIFLTYEEHCDVRDQIECLVMDLIMEFRRERDIRPFRHHATPRPPTHKPAD
jgi:arsenate reductase (thioredoxin)